MDTDPILTHLQENNVFIITFNRPKKKNAFNNQSWLALRDAFKEARENDNISVIVITGTGNDFTAGLDLSESVGVQGGESPFDLMMDELIKLDKPMIAAANGVAVGFGATVLFHCDIVYVGQNLRFRLPFVTIGLVPEAASSHLIQASIGYQKSAELFFTADWVDSKKAVELGIAAAGYSDDVLLESALKKADDIAQWPMRSLRATKRCLKATNSIGIAKAREIEIQAMKEQMGSPENVEAVTAFMEKRKPNFRNL